MSQEIAKTIMIVEDHSAVSVLLQQYLRVEFPGHRFISASRGDQAVGLVAAENPDLVVMDIQLPGINGIEATRKIKAAHPGVKVVMLSNHEESEYLDLAAKAGASGYVPKRAIHDWLIPLMKKFLHEPIHRRRWIFTRSGPAWLPGEIVPEYGIS
jgi:DNA-binding NarL/FixJ family response regulator